MTEDLAAYEKTLRKKHSFSWTPKFERETRTILNEKVFSAVVVKVFEKLEWDVVYQGEKTIEAKRKGDWDRWTEKITVQLDYGKVKVKSVSLGNEMWDNGRNSKRVHLFIHALEQTESEYDRVSLAELETEVERSQNWDDYEIPESLPLPKERRAPTFTIPVVGGLVFALVMGFLVAFISTEIVYFIGVFEVGVAIALAFVLKLLIKLGNYSEYDNLNYLLIGMIIVTYLSNQYFQYQLILSENSLPQIGFGSFMQRRLESGLKLKSIDTGWIGLVVSWIFQLGFTYLIGILRLISGLTKVQLERVPMEVVDFAFYHFVKEKDERGVRNELAQKGWSTELNQDEVFEAIGAIYGAQNLQQME